MESSFAVHKLAKFSENSGKLHFEGLVHLLRYIRDNKDLGFKYYADMNDAPLSDLLIQASIKTENQLMALSDSSIQDFPDTGISTGVYCSEKLHLQSYLEMIWSKTGYFGLLGNNYILLIILLYIIER